ncbi:MAG: hypothetical protein HZC55_28175 [Verrucomicrobia bacterium]|nr:hypothetical protein [Verrucomicrobiota bacterium]
MSVTTQPSPPAAPPRWVWALVLGIGAAVFLPVLRVGFLADDFVYIARFRELPWAAWPRLFFHDWSDGVWGSTLKELRPFAALSLMIDGRLWGGHVIGYRLVNLTLHLAAVALVVQLAWTYAGRRAAAAVIAGLVFALHPAHVEAVTWITGRPDLLGSIAALAFVLTGERFSSEGGRGSGLLALGAFFVGVFTKEFCLTIPLLLALRWILLDRHAGAAAWRRRGALLLGAIVVVAIYAVARRLAFGSDPTTGFFGWNDAPAWQRQAGYWGWLAPILPFTTGATWTATPPMGVLRGLWILVAAVVTGALGFAAVRRAAWGNAIFFGGLWWFATTLGLFVAVYFSPRHLYLPTAGIALGLGLALAGGRVRHGLAALVLLWCTAAHVAALQPWRTAGRISTEVLAALDADLAGGDPTTVALVSVPETFGPVLLWAWSSPQALGAPFLRHPVPTERILERVVNYVRSDRWLPDRRPVETVRAANSAAAVYVDPAGRVHHRRLSRAELQIYGDKLAALVAQGLNPDNLADWLKACALP